MPKVVESNGMVVRVYVRDEHPPPHVHVQGADWEVRVLIGEAATFWNVAGGRPNNKQIAQAEALVAEYLEACSEAWRKFHG